MTHDPLCPSVTACDCKHDECCFCDSDVWCMCRLIEKVRADERNRVFTHLDALADRDHAQDCLSLTCTGCAEGSVDAVQIVQ